MNRSISLSILTLTVAGVAFAWHQGVLDQSTRPGQAAAPASSTIAKIPASSSAAPVAEDLVAAASAPTQPGKAPLTGSQSADVSRPSFDVVRVEPDGSALVAGRGAPNTVLRLENGTQTLAEARTDATGAFVVDLTLQPGEHRLRLAEADRSGPSEGGEEALVNVPEKHRKDDLLVMVERPGEPSRILAAPKGSGSDATVASTEIASAPPRNAGVAVAPTSQLKIEAVEAEGGKLFVAGAAKRDTPIRVYLNDQLVSETTGGEGDRFIASAHATVGIGDHVVRADEIDATGRVTARVEVPFNRPDTAPLAAVASAPYAGPNAVAPSDESTGPSESAVTGDVAELESVPATTVQPALKTVESRVIIRRGDTLWRISRNTYGRGSRFTVIVLANGDQIRNPNRIYPGQVFRMPDHESEAKAVN